MISAADCRNVERSFIFGDKVIFVPPIDYDLVIGSKDPDRIGSVDPFEVAKFRRAVAGIRRLMLCGDLRAAYQRRMVLTFHDLRAAYQRQMVLTFHDHRDPVFLELLCQRGEAEMILRMRRIDRFGDDRFVGDSIVTTMMDDAISNLLLRHRLDVNAAVLVDVVEDAE
jgi:hypothetical protein